MRKGWFVIPEVQDGARTVEDQSKGLDYLWPVLAGHTVLDLGCAEGLIANRCRSHGARHVLGLDINREAIDAADRLALDDHVEFVRWDLNDVPPATADIVLMLAILHKLRHPEKLLRGMLARRPMLVVIRIPPEHAPVIIDARSGNEPCDVEAVANAMGYRLERVMRGHLDEWTGYFRP